MNYRTLGRTGLNVSEVGFGGGGIGSVWGPTTDQDVIRAVHRAIDVGVNFFDVAPAYGEGKAEALLGQALDGRRDRVIVATKIQVPPERLDDFRRYTHESLEASLHRLRTDYVDLLQLHNSISRTRNAPLPGAMTAADALAIAEVMHDLRRSGKVRFAGFTAWRAHKQELAAMLDSAMFDTLQTEYNLLNMTAMEPPPPGTDIMDDAQTEAVGSGNPLSFRYRRVDQGVTIPKAVARQMGIICIRPYLAGILTDALDRPVEPGPMEQLVRYGRALAFVKQPGARTLSQAALVFCLMNPHISTVVPGAKNTAEIEEAVACSGAPPLSAGELQKIMDLYRKNYDAS